MNNNVKESHYCQLKWNSSAEYEIGHRRNKFVVKLDIRFYTCGAWGRSRIPCPHALCALDNKDEDLENYSSHWYKKDRYLKTYNHIIQPINGKR